MAGFTYSTLTTAIGNYTEVGTSVLSSTITDQFIDNSELRIQRDVPIDADRKEVIGNLVASKDNINVPACIDFSNPFIFVRNSNTHLFVTNPFL